MADEPDKKAKTKKTSNKRSDHLLQVHSVPNDDDDDKDHNKEKKELLAAIDYQSNKIKQHVEDSDEMAGKLSQQSLLVDEKEETIGMMKRQHKEKDELIARLMIEMEEKNNTIDELRQQVARVVEQNTEATQNVNEKQLVIDQKELALKELTEQLQISQVQLQEYEDGFNNERKDRTRMGSELDEKRAQVLALQQSLHDETHKTKELETKYRSLQEIVQQQKNELSVKDEAAKDWEEEKHMLTTQVNSYARQGAELKKSLTEQTDKCKTLEEKYKESEDKCKTLEEKYKESEDKCKTLEEKCKALDDQLIQKIETESEVDKLKQDLESERNSKQHLVSAFNQGKVKVTVLEQEKMKLEGVVKTGLAEKAQLQQIIAQEQARMEEERNKSRNANKVLREKLQAAEAQLGYAYQSQPHHRPSGSPHITPSGPPQGHIHQGGHAPHISERRNYPSTGNIGGYHQGTPAQATSNENHSQVIVSSAGQSHNEQQQYSDSHDMPPPQMNLQQMQQYSRHALQQREQQQQQQLEELYRVRGEEYRRRDEDLRRMQEEQEMKGAIADRELAELEKLKREMAERKPVKPLPSHYQYSSRNEEMVISAVNQPMNKEKKSDEIPENELLAGIDNEIQYYAEEVRRMSRPPVTAEVIREDDDSSLPYDPNLVCPKCGKQYRIGQIQYFRCHLEGLCQPDTEDVIVKVNLTEEIQYYAEEVRRMSRPPNTAEVMREDDDSSLPYDPNLVCPKCGKQYRIGQIQYLRRHLEEFCPLLNKQN